MWSKKSGTDPWWRRSQELWGDPAQAVPSLTGSHIVLTDCPTIPGHGKQNQVLVLENISAMASSKPGPRSSQRIQSETRSDEVRNKTESPGQVWEVQSEDRTGVKLPKGTKSLKEAQLWTEVKTDASTTQWKKELKPQACTEIGLLGW